MLANNNNKIIHRYRRRNVIARTGRIGSEGNVYDVLCHDGDDRGLQGSLIACMGAATNRNPMTGLCKYEGTYHVRTKRACSQ